MIAEKNHQNWGELCLPEVLLVPWHTDSQVNTNVVQFEFSSKLDEGVTPIYFCSQIIMLEENIVGFKSSHQVLHIQTIKHIISN